MVYSDGPHTCTEPHMQQISRYLAGEEECHWHINDATSYHSHYICPYFQRTSNYVTQTLASAQIQGFPPSLMTAAFQTKSSTSRNHWKCLLIFSLGVTFPQITPDYKPTLVPAFLDPREEPRTIIVTQLTNWWHWIGEWYYGCSERGGKARVAWERLLANMLLWLDLNNNKKKRQPQTSICRKHFTQHMGQPRRLGHSGRQRWGGGSTPALLAGPSCPEAQGTE